MDRLVLDAGSLPAAAADPAVEQARVAAGIISAIATATAATSKAYSVEEWADFDTTVSTQMGVLASEVRYDRKVTEQDYDSYVRRLRI